MQFQKQLCAFFLLLIPVLLYSQNNQKIISIDSEVYNELETLYLEQGYALPSQSRPWSADQFDKAIEVLDPAKLSPAGRTTLEHIRSALKPRLLLHDKKLLGFNTALNTNLEVYIRSNPAKTTWEHGYEERLPLLTVPFELWLFNGFYADLEITLKEEYRAISEDPKNYTNIPRKLTYFDLYFPFTAFFSLGGNHWNIQFGRDRVDWGNGNTGNMMISSFVDFYDFLKFDTYWKNFKFISLYAILDPWTKPGEETAGELYKAFFGHRLEFSFLKRFSIAVAEAMIFGGKYPSLRDFNPLMIFHNWYITEYGNSMMTIEVNVNPYKWVNLYLQYAMDEFQTPYEEEQGAGGRSAANGILGGLKGALPLGKGHLGFNAELAKTDPWLYNRTPPLTKYTARRMIWSFILPDGYEWVDKPLGYRYGPDAIVQNYSLNYSIAGFFTTGISFQIRDHGEMSIDTPFATGREAQSLKTPTGILETTRVLKLGGEIFPFRFLSIGSNLYWINTTNSGHVAGVTENDIEWITFIKFRL
ncbi:MAG: capsule assembly Wzi family protein [Spirochaetota bacterium]